MSNVLGVWANSHAEPDLRWRGTDLGGDGAHGRVLGGLGEPGERRSEREVRHPRDVLGHAEFEQIFVGPVEQAVGVLHADDARRQRFLDDFDWHTADSDRADLALVAQRDHFGQLIVEVDELVAFGLQPGPEVEPAQVHHVDVVDAQLCQVRFDGSAELGGPLRGGERNGARHAAGADLAHDDERRRGRAPVRLGSGGSTSPLE